MSQEHRSAALVVVGPAFTTCVRECSHQVGGWGHILQPHNMSSTFCWTIWFITFRAVSRWLSPWRPGCAILGLTSTQNTWKSCSKQGGGGEEREQHTTHTARRQHTLPAPFSGQCTRWTAGQWAARTPLLAASKSGRSTRSNTRTTCPTWLRIASATDTALDATRPWAQVNTHIQRGHRTAPHSVSVRQLQIRHEQFKQQSMQHAPLQRRPCLQYINRPRALTVHC